MEKKKLGSLDVDNHEPQYMVGYLEDLGWIVHQKHLEVADYVRGEAALERKTVNDMVNSIRSNRFWNQLAGLKQYSMPYVGVVGRTAEIRRWQDTKPFLGAYARISRKDEEGHGFGIPALRADSDRELAYIIHSLFKDIDETKRPQEVKRRPYKRTNQEIREDMFSTIPGIGLKTAKMILEGNKNFADFVDVAFLGDTLEKKIGKKKTDRVLEVLFSE